MHKNEKNSPHQSETLQCMRVWSNNQLFDGSICLSGLDVHLYSRPHGKSEGGGDLVHLSSCATGRITRLLVADVSGHGQAVSSVALFLRQLMEKNINHIDQTRLVGAMNRQFTRLQEDHIFATALVLSHFGPTGEVTLCNAGHPPPLLYRQQTASWSMLEVPDGLENLPLGMIDLSRYSQLQLRLDPGDRILCFTDSLIEAQDSQQKMLSTTGLLERVRQLDPSDDYNLIPSLLETLRSLDPSNLSGDDVTVLLFGPSTIAYQPGYTTRLLAPVRLALNLVGSLLPGRSRAGWPEWSLANLGGALFGLFERTWSGPRNAQVFEENSFSGTTNGGRKEQE